MVDPLGRERLLRELGRASIELFLVLGRAVVDQFGEERV